MTPFERDRRVALLAAVHAEAAGVQLGARVRRRQKEILGRRGPWISIDPEALGELVARLDGHASAARNLGVASTTLRRWAEGSKIPAWAIARLSELIAAGASSRRRQNRVTTRHYGRA
jgi:hypothetical protein